jgi:N-sulfoglucosamine sulfohydrolase
VAKAREGNLPYPMRSLRTAEFAYIRNFAPDRWPLGSPGGEAPAGTLESNTFATFADMDASPTKSWLVRHQDDPAGTAFYELAFGKRPAEELYDLAKDPDQVKNVAADPAYAARKKELADRLAKLLADAGDPRVTGDGQTFDQPPFTDAVEGGGKKGKGK